MIHEIPATHSPRIRGLSSTQVEERRRQFGSNVITPPPREPWWRLYLKKFDDPVIRILLIAAVIAIGLGAVHGEYVEGLGIIAAIILATTLAFWNDYRAACEFDILNQVDDDQPIKVIREGACVSVPRRNLVVGDVVLIEAGEETPADGTLLEAVSLQVNEASLTGEAEPNTKVARGGPNRPAADGAAGDNRAARGLEPAQRTAQASSADGRDADATDAEGSARRNPGSNDHHPGGPDTHETTYPADVILRSSLVLDGRGMFEVTAVGDRTEIGRAARAAVAQIDAPTPLNRQLERLSKLIGAVGLLVAVGTFAAQVVRGTMTGRILLTAPQWTVVSVLGLGVGGALSQVWLPMIFDGLEIALGAATPRWARRKDGANGVGRWLVAMALGAAIVALGLAGGWSLNLIPASPSDWVSDTAASELLGYFMIAVTIIVVAVPEGLAMSVTLSLAYSMRKMAAANTLVRRMHACETIGAATVICSDKTGTLTMNQMRVGTALFPALGDAPLSAADGWGALMIESLSANTTAHLDRSDDDATGVLGNPTEGALLLWLQDQGIDYVPWRESFSVLRQLTFSTEHKWMGTYGVSARTGQPVLYAKGAPELLLTRCTHLLTSDGPAALDGHRDEIVRGLAALQRRGMRTLGVAYRDAPAAGDAQTVDALAHGLTWLGLLAIWDPVRPEVPPAIAACQRAGIRVKMVTGDNADTAQEIGRQIGLWASDEPRQHHLSGPEFRALDDAQVVDAADELKILSRAKPLDKVRLVRALQAAGEVVAVTGDGINDCGALNQADVGLAMGRTGKDAAKEASDIILLDDSFRTIVDAVMWGRSLYENIQRFVLFQLTINVAALGIALLGPFLGVALPLTVIQMLWVNLIMDTFAALALATEPPHPEVLDRPPRSPQAFIITSAMTARILGTAAVFLVALVAMLLGIQRDGRVTPYELSVFFSVFVLLQFWNLFNARCLGLDRSAFANLGQSRGFVAIAVAILVGQVLIVQLGGRVFRTVPLSWTHWLLILSATSVVLWFGELARWSARRRAAAVV